MPNVSRLEVIETGARRRWTLEEKLRIVEESARAPRMVSATARRHGLSANQLFVWRRMVREGKLDGNCGAAVFVPAIVAPEERSGRSASCRIEIVLSEPRRLIIEGSVDAEAVARMIAMLDR